MPWNSTAYSFPGGCVTVFVRRVSRRPGCLALLFALHAFAAAGEAFRGNFLAIALPGTLPEWVFFTATGLGLGPLALGIKPFT
jgi:hypothetical protein